MGTVVYFDQLKRTICSLRHLHVVVLGLRFCLRDMLGGTVMIYECLLPLKFQYSRLSHDVSFITEIAGITALCMSLNLIKHSSQLKENIEKKNKVH